MCKEASNLLILERLSQNNYTACRTLQKTGYGQASYLHLIDENGQIHCLFVAGKARATPRKTMSIPRLEFVAATVLVWVADMLKAESDYKEVEDFYWTGSEVALGFINNKS